MEKPNKGPDQYYTVTHAAVSSMFENQKIVLTCSTHANVDAGARRCNYCKTMPFIDK